MEHLAFRYVDNSVNADETSMNRMFQQSSAKQFLKILSLSKRAAMWVRKKALVIRSSSSQVLLPGSHGMADHLYKLASFGFAEAFYFLFPRRRIILGFY